MLYPVVFFYLPFNTIWDFNHFEVGTVPAGFISKRFNSEYQKGVGSVVGAVHPFYITVSIEMALAFSNFLLCAKTTSGGHVLCRSQTD